MGGSNLSDQKLLAPETFQGDGGLKVLQGVPGVMKKLQTQNSRICAEYIYTYIYMCIYIWFQHVIKHVARWVVDCFGGKPKCMTWSLFVFIMFDDMLHRKDSGSRYKKKEARNLGPCRALSYRAKRGMLRAKRRSSWLQSAHNTNKSLHITHTTYRP